MPAHDPTEPGASIVLAVTTEDSGRVVLELAGELDVSNISQLHAAAENVLSGEVRELLLDVRSVTFIDSTGVGALIAVYRRCLDAEVEFRLLPSRRVRSVLDLMALSEVLPGADDTVDG